MKNMMIDRRKFLKNAGIGSVALASLQALVKPWLGIQEAIIIPIAVVSGDQAWGYR